MSLENAKRIAEEARHVHERYARFTSETVNQLANGIQSNWNDDVGACAFRSLKSVSNTWDSAVSDGIAGVSSALQTIQKIYSEIAALGGEVEAAAQSAESVMGRGG